MPGKVQLRRNLEDDTAAPGAGRARAALLRRACEISLRVKYQTVNRTCPVTAASKIVERCVCPTAPEQVSLKPAPYPLAPTYDVAP